MSTGKLDQSLDDILKTRRQSSRRGRGSRRPGAGRPAATEAPVGGVQKTTKQAKQAKAVPTGPASGATGESKIMISNLVCSFMANMLWVAKLTYVQAFGR
jgi:THO complex subunit 4